VVSLIRADARSLPLRDGCVQCVVTSPPYFGLRDYGISGQIGLEPTPDAYVAQLVQVFREVRRVLADDGLLFLNLGDSYVSQGGHTGQGSTSQRQGRSNVAAQNHNSGRAPCAGLKIKDLIGIPWRVAFALQAPDYLGNIRQERDRAWLAALVDGEGCITILETSSPHGSGESYPLVLQVRMCDVECIEHAAAITGYGNASPVQEPPSHGGNRGSYQWRLNGRKAADTLAEIYPYLLIKRQQAVVAWNHQQVRDSYQTKKGQPVPREAVEKQQFCRDLIQRLNRRETVDIPSWMQEPPQPIGPGWYLRSDCIWHKPNPMPESVTDRPTKAHEYLFLLSKGQSYYYDADAIAEAATGVKTGGFSTAVDAARKAVASGGKPADVRGMSWETRNRRSVWTVPTAPYPGAHFATFPEKLVEPCVLAGSRYRDRVLDPFGGTGTVVKVARRFGRIGIATELNPDYLRLARERIQATGGLPLEAA
jgi:hypothetical protein